MTSEGEDHHALQIFNGNCTITPEYQKVPKGVLDTVPKTINVEEHFWHYKDKILSDLRQKRDEGMHALSNCNTMLISDTKFTHLHTKETLKIMLLQQAVQYHKARDWIT